MSGFQKMLDEGREARCMSGYHDCCGMSRLRGHHDLCPRIMAHQFRETPDA